MGKVIFFSVIIFGLATTISFSQANFEGFTVDVLPTNIGGKAEFKRIFEQELVYPVNSLKKRIGGKITFNFNVMKDSSVTDIISVDSIPPDIKAEAMRLFKLYQWVPAVKGGQYISTKWSATFDFNPDKYGKICNQRGFNSFKYIQDTKLDSSGTIYKNPEQFPMYQKGNYALLDFIKENLEYPRQAQLSNIQGTVILRFVVEPSGLVTNIGIEKSIGGGCDQEAIRVLKLIKWYPGKNTNKLARIQMAFPFYFILNEEFKDNSNGEQK
ncbi:MAG: TonB family protein [Bacteroidetes bacterium]|nr:TonB family protein [Bacteroidota bacterium]